MKGAVHLPLALFCSYATQDSPLYLSFTVDSSSCGNVGFLEHVVVTATISLVTDGYASYGSSDYYSNPSVLNQNGPRRGNISVELVSPSGTTSLLLPKRPNDYVNDEGYYQWPFMSLHHWGENPSGTWTLTINYDSTYGYVTLESLSMTMYGTESTPTAVQNIPTKCSSQCVRGCAAKGAKYCDACRKLRMASSLQCVNSCPTGQCGVSGYCVHCNPFRLSALAITGIAAGGLALLLLSATLLTYIGCRKCDSPHANYETL